MSIGKIGLLFRNDQIYLCAILPNPSGISLIEDILLYNAHLLDYAKQKVTAHIV
jgi:hypothetical protein